MVPKLVVKELMAFIIMCYTIWGEIVFDYIAPKYALFLHALACDHRDNWE